MNLIYKIFKIHIQNIQNYINFTHKELKEFSNKAILIKRMWFKYIIKVITYWL